MGADTGSKIIVEMAPEGQRSVFKKILPSNDLFLPDLEKLRSLLRENTRAAVIHINHGMKTFFVFLHVK